MPSAEFVDERISEATFETFIGNNGWWGEFAENFRNTAKELVDFLLLDWGLDNPTYEQKQSALDCARNLMVESYKKNVNEGARIRILDLRSRFSNIVYKQNAGSRSK